MAQQQSTSGTVRTLPCAMCGQQFTFTVKSKGRYQRYCSIACRHQRIRQQVRRPGTRRAHDKTCIECGAAFSTPNASTACCSRECGWKRGKRRQDEWRAEQARKRHARICESCGSQFVMRRPSGKANRGIVLEGQFCSRECAGSQKLWPSYEERRRAINRMKKQAPFDATDVFERDHWHCGICGYAVSSTLNYPDPRSGCVNLTIPPSKGGKRTWDNVKLAHLTCAVRRRARPMESR